MPEVITSTNSHKEALEKGWIPMSSFELDMDEIAGNEVFATYKLSLDGGIDKMAFTVFSQVGTEWKPIAYSDFLGPASKVRVFIKKEGGKNALFVTVDLRNSSRTTEIILEKLDRPDPYGLSYWINMGF